MPCTIGCYVVYYCTQKLKLHDFSQVTTGESFLHIFQVPRISDLGKCVCVNTVINKNSGNGMLDNDRPN